MRWDLCSREKESGVGLQISSRIQVPGLSGRRGPDLGVIQVRPGPPRPQTPGKTRCVGASQLGQSPSIVLPRAASENQSVIAPAAGAAEQSQTAGNTSLFSVKCNWNRSPRISPTGKSS